MAVRVFHKSPAELEAASGGNLVARAQRGEEAAFAALFEAYKRRVYGLCRRMTGSPQENLAQMVGTTRSRVSHFMNKFRKLGFVEYDSGMKLTVDSSAWSCTSKIVVEPSVIPTGPTL